MKVRTNLKSGSALQTLSEQVGSAASNVTGFFSKANREAEALTKGVANTTTSLYNCVTRSLGLS